VTPNAGCGSPYRSSPIGTSGAPEHADGRTASRTSDEDVLCDLQRLLSEPNEALNTVLDMIALAWMALAVLLVVSFDAALLGMRWRRDHR
jgi:hypothetical protein